MTDGLSVEHHFFFFAAIKFAIFARNLTWAGMGGGEAGLSRILHLVVGAPKTGMGDILCVYLLNFMY